MKFDEGAVERAMVEMLKELGWSHVHGTVIAPDGSRPERPSYADTVLVGRLRDAIKRLNPLLPAEAQDAAFRAAIRPPGTTVLLRNRAFHRMLTDGVPVEFKGKDGKIRGDRARLVSLDEVRKNDWLVVNQFTVEITGPNGGTRRPDIVLFVNGLPLLLVELKNPADPDATMQDAFNQLRTYQDQIPDIFSHNEALVITDGIEASMGTITSDFGRFMAWKTIDGRKEQSGADQMETLVRGALTPERILDLVSGYIAFEDGISETQKKMAAYHQYWAVKKAVESTAEAAAVKGDRRAGVVWHTQGSGKSLSMIFYTAGLIRDPRFRNPTIVVITDRNDLDGQLFGNFASVPDLIPAPEQAEDRQDLRDRLKRASGGVVFTTIQKFSTEEGEKDYPTLSERENIIVRRSRPATESPERCLASTSISTTSSSRCATTRPFPSPTRRASRRSISIRNTGRTSTPTSRKSPRPRRRAPSGRWNRDGLGSRPWSAPMSGCERSLPTSSSTSRSDSTPWKARRWSSA